MADTQMVQQGQFKPLSVMLSERLDMESVNGGIPKDFNKARFVQNALALVNSNIDYSKYAPEQIISGLLRGAYLGLDFMSKEAYLIPYGPQLNYQTSYLGERKLVKRYSTRKIKDVCARVIREGDVLEEKIVRGEPSFDFTPKPMNTGKIVGAIAWCIYADGGIQYETMTAGDIETVRRKSKMQNGMAWKDFYGEMCKKTVLRRLCKQIDIEFENPQQRQIYDEDMAIQDDSKTVRVEQEFEENSIDFVEDA